MFQGHTHSLASSSNNLHYLFCGKCSRIGSALKRKKCWVILFPFAGARQFGGRQLCHNFNSSRSSECINETSLLQCDQTLDLKSCPNVFKSYLNNIQSSFTLIDRFLNGPKVHNHLKATFVSEFVVKNFQKSPNLVALACYFSGPENRNDVTGWCVIL